MTLSYQATQSGKITTTTTGSVLIGTANFALTYIDKYPVHAKKLGLNNMYCT